MKITIVQSRGLMQDPTVNFFKARMRINNIDSDMFIFPEMFCSGYTGVEEEMKLNLLPEKIFNKLANLSEMRGSAIICGCPIKEDGKLYDAALVIDGQKQNFYKKMKLTSEGAFDETKTFTPGNQPCIIDHMGFKIGLSIGDDLLLHGLYRFYSENGVDLIVCISAYNDSQMDKFEKIVMCRAAENGIPAVICNMVGPDCGIKLAGRSKYIGADGNIIESCTDSSDVRTITFSDEDIKKIRENRKPIGEVKFGECLRYDTHSYEGQDPDDSCIFAGM